MSFIAQRNFWQFFGHYQWNVCFSVSYRWLLRKEFRRFMETLWPPRFVI